jgi:hypothetical protein
MPEISLREILETAIRRIALKWSPECNDYDKDSDHSDCPVYKFIKDEVLEVDLALSQIIEKVKGCIPYANVCPMHFGKYHEGCNECLRFKWRDLFRQQLLEAIEKLEGGKG